jgi:putative ABC transport system permease protein
MSWSRFVRRSRWDAERAKELQDYLAHEIDDNIARGMDHDAATRAAHRKLGNPTRIREEIYEMNTLPVIDTVWQDLRFGMRLLRKSPTFSIVAILTLALGTGANAAIFELVNAVRLRTLPVENSHELVSIGIDNHGKGRVGRGYRGRSIHTEPVFQALRSQQQAFSSVIAWGTDTWDLANEGESKPAQGMYVTGGYFDTLGVRPHIGRLFTETDDHKGCGTPGAVLSYDFWQSRYGSNAGVIGQPITLDRQPFHIIGVAPPHFFGVEVGRTFDVAIPLCAEAITRGQFAGIGQPAVWWLDVIGRLKPDWTIDRAAAHLATLSPDIFKSTVSPRYNPEMAKDYLAFNFTAQSAETGVSNLRTRYATPIWVLLGATGLVLLITCANLANLMLARATTRDREIAVRLAIGASRGRVVRQLLAESLLIAAFGAAAGLVLARWLSQALVMFMSTEGNRLFVDLTPDWRMFAFVSALAVLACLLFGLSPALKATRTDPAKTMQAGGRSSTEGHEAFGLRRGLVVLQIAMSIMLIVGALLFGRSLRNLANVDLGFRPDGIVSVAIDLRRTTVPEAARLQTFEQIAARIRAVPGVRNASEVFVTPLSGGEWNQPILIGGVLQEEFAYFNQVGSEYFRTIETPLLIGRTFDARDRVDAPLTAIVNETFARRYFPNGSPVGQIFQMEGPPGRPQPPYHVVGLAKDSKYSDLRQEFLPIAYLPLSQEAQPAPFVEIVVRSETPVAALTPALTRAIVETVPGASMSYRTISDFMSELMVTERLMATLSGFFGVLAMLIATIGLYGVVSYMVTRRRGEIGIRLALGADPRAVVRMVLAESGWLLAIGLTIGVALSVVAARYAVDLLYGIEPADPTSFAIAIAVLGCVTLLAAWIPARRASRTAPTVALREQ